MNNIGLLCREGKPFVGLLGRDPKGFVGSEDARNVYTRGGKRSTFAEKGRYIGGAEIPPERGFLRERHTRGGFSSLGPKQGETRG